jgi:glycosyltransferase involved in cell wall biosynthesis
MNDQFKSQKPRVLIFLSALDWPGDEVFLQQHSRVNPFAGSNYSHRMFDAFLGTGLYSSSQVFTALSIGSFPRNSNSLFVRSKNHGQNVTQVSFCNILGFRDRSIYRSLKRACSRWLKQGAPTEPNLVFDIVVGEAEYPYIRLAEWLKKRLKAAKITLLAPDLPELSSTSKRHGLPARLNNKRARKIYKIANSSVDGFVFLSEMMKDSFLLSGKKWSVIEGVSELPVCNHDDSSNRKGAIVYTGTTSLQYAHLDRAIEAVKILKKRNPGIELVVAGAGGYSDALKAADSRGEVRYLGVIPPAEAESLQTSADILINLRENDPVFRFSFPSKIFDYLRSGKPIVCYQIDSIPKEYDDVLIYPKDYSVESLAETFEKCLHFSNDERAKIEQKSFSLLRQKTVEATSKKLLDLLCKERS